jgi:putative transposase
VCRCCTPTWSLVTKYRRRVRGDAMLTDCEAALRNVCADLVRRLKGTSARRLRVDRTGHCNHARMHDHFWTPSYFAVSCGGTTVDHQAVHREPSQTL